MDEDTQKENDGAIGKPSVLRISSRDPVRDLFDSAREAANSAHVSRVGSTGAETLEPLVMATQNGATAFHPNVSSRDIGEIVMRLEEGEIASGAEAVVKHDPNIPTLPIPSLRPLNVGSRTVLRRCGWVSPTSIADYEKTGGLSSPQADDSSVLERVRGLKGRGWGDVATDEPIDKAWEEVKEHSGDSVMIVNAHSTETADSLLLRSDPFAVVGGALTCARVVGANEVVFYVNETDGVAHDRVEKALNSNSLVEGEIDTRLVSAPEDYKAGEVTMALEAIEGSHRLEARLRPPYPSQHGLNGRPTLIHTPRTLAHVEMALSENNDKDTRVFTITGDVDSRAVVELSTDSNLSSILDGVGVEGEFKAAYVGGEFGGLTRDLEIKPDVEGLKSAGLGTDGVVEFLNQNRCMVAFAGERSKFAHEENCGRCVPCREGSKQMTQLLRNIYEGDYDEDKIRELLRVMEDTSICEFGMNAPRPVTTAMDLFENEFLEHSMGRCPTGTCEMTKKNKEVST
ncbi:MAG: NADH-ubiquinone oxidoreductase-F iron-sulfur binding region domain-containing protein [Halobacteria archaeon]|nr:NADH-ubiquinone oxidoreductase-F iron-sulfur binding region domain-containing protein [Halobacteria archaeon]